MFCNLNNDLFPACFYIGILTKLSSDVPLGHWQFNVTVRDARKFYLYTNVS